jgi:ribosome-associated protein
MSDINNDVNLDTQNTVQNSPEGRALVDLVATEIFAKKAEDVTLIEMNGMSNVCDRFLIATCQSEPQMRAILTSLARVLRKNGVRPLGTDHYQGSRWAVMDLGELMVHLFEAEHRKFYSLERLWADAKKEELNAADYTKASADTQEQLDNEYI